MRTGKFYRTTLINKTEPVKFTVLKRLAKGEVFENGGSNAGCGNEDCTECTTVATAPSTEHRKIEVALTSKSNLVVRKLNYSKNREESHQIFESIPHIVANLNASLPEEAMVITQLNALDVNDLTGTKAAEAAEAQAQADYEAKLAAKAALEAATIEV